MNISEPKQHGIYPGRSTATNLMKYLVYWSEAESEGETVLFIMFDWSKAFDRIPHDVCILGAWVSVGRLLCLATISFLAD